jgi:F0F1-type ATP synthase assembly protein I
MVIKLSHIPPRAATGAFILNAGLGKRGLDQESAAYMQQMAAGAFPQAGKIDTEQFGKILAGVEIGLGALLLAPFVPSRLAGLALVGFSAGLLTMYLKTEGLTESDGVRPTQAGTPVAKDVWMLGIGLGLLLDQPKKRK